MNAQKTKDAQRRRRRLRVRNKVRGTAERPRLTVFRSSKHIYAQLIDDDTGRTLASASSKTKREKPPAGDYRTVKANSKGEARKKKRALVADEPYGGNVKAAKAVGLKLAEAAKAAGITKAAFDRGQYKYHGRIEALADGAREGGLDLGPGRVKDQPASEPTKAADASEAKPAKKKKPEK